MAIGFGKPVPKPQKARGVSERTVIQKVRAKCVARDGICRIQQAMPFASCFGGSQWAHMAGHRRFETVNKSPAERHDSKWTLMLCTLHHAQYDARLLEIEPLTSSGADDTLRVIRPDGVSVLSVPGGERG